MIYNKNLLLMLSLSVFLIGGVLVGNTYSTLPAGSDEDPVLISSDSIQAVGGISMYTESSTSIVIGEIKTVSDHLNETDVPYTRSVLDATMEISSVLKGDPQMKVVTVKMIGGQEGMISPESGFISLAPKDKVLLFLKTDNEGDTVVFGDVYGKYLIDEEGRVTGANGVKMSLDELKKQIQDALDASSKL